MDKVIDLLLSHPWSMAFGLALAVAAAEDARNPSWYYRRLWTLRTLEGHEVLKEPLSQIGSALTRFHLIVERLFGRNVPFFRRLLRSSVASLVGMVATWATAALFFTDWTKVRRRPGRPLIGEEILAYTLVYVVGIGISFPLTVLPDYLSLAQTRRFVAWAARSRGSWRIAGILLFDLLVTSAIILTLGSAAGLTHYSRMRIMPLQAGRLVVKVEIRKRHIHYGDQTRDSSSD